MNSSKRHDRRIADAVNTETLAKKPGKVAYTKPSVKEAGSVFLRTQALGQGTKDVINGSTLL